MTDITPFWLAAYRIGFGAALTVLVWRVRGGALFAGPVTAGTLANLVVIGVLSSALPFMLISWGQQFVTAGFTGVSMASAALIVLPLAHFLVPGERITLRRAAGFGIGFLGVAILIGGKAFESTGVALEMPGRLACVCAAACYATSSVMMRRLPPVDPVGLSAVLLMIGAAAVLPLAWAVEGPPRALDPRTLWILAFLGLVPTAAANLLRVTVVRSAQLGRAVMTTVGVPDAPSGKVRQAWLKVPTGMVSAGLLPPGTDVSMLLEGDARTAEGAGLSIEPAGGATSPGDDVRALFAL